MAAGDFFIFHLSGYGTWTNLKVWAEAAPSYVPPVITITSQPTDQTASGGAATFSMSASVTAGSLTYQWYRQAKGDGSFTAMSGQTASTLSLTGLSAGTNDGDVYRCVASRACVASVTSNDVTLTVLASGSTSPFYSPNTAWQAIGFSGDGSAGNRFYKARLVNQPLSEAKIRVANSGFVSVIIDAVTYEQSFFFVEKNSSPVQTIGSYVGGLTQVGVFPISIPVNPGDTIGFRSYGSTDVLNIAVFFQGGNS
jgi:hypothetical protein